MALDGIFLSFLTAEISDALVGAKVDKVHQPAKNELVLVMRTRTGMYKLLMTADPNSARFNITENPAENPQNPPMLCMLLRKRLIGATLTSVIQQSLDRVAFFNFDASNEIGDRVKLTLVIEIMAQHSNIILIDENERIIDAVRRVDSEKSSFRLVLPGAQYKLPPAQYKTDLRTVTAGEAASLILKLDSQYFSSAVLKTLQGVSPLLSREIAYRVCYEDKAANSLTNEEKLRLEATLGEIKLMLDNNAPEPCIALDASGKPSEFSFLPIKQYSGAVSLIKKDTLSQLLDTFYSERDRLSRTKSKAAELFKQLENVTERTARKLNNQREDLKRSADREELKIKGELITANQYKLNKGASVYEVEDYYNNNEVIKVAVDPALTPSQNAQKLYKEYRKACTAENMLIKLIDEGENDLKYLESVKDLLIRSSLEREFYEIKEELVAEGFIKPKKERKKQMKKQSLPPLEFKTSGGLTVLVGRNNIQNDKLTFKTAQKGDIWLHAQKCPGSHTILKKGEGEIADSDFVEAAEIAAFYSSAKDSTLVTVDYSDVKNIKKPNGAKPGFVVYYTYYSVNVKPKDGNK